VRPDDERYFERLESQLDAAFDVAREAKRRGGDPKPEVEIPVAKDMADRVENILGIDGVAERVRDLEGQMSREEAALELVGDFVEGTVGDYDTDAGKIEGAVRTAVALLTEGVVAAPIEGIDRVEVNDNDDGTQFVSVYYAGPIRSAGGTAQALSVLVADYARALLGIDEYKARDDEVERYAEEVALYDAETGLQYTPKDKETKFIAKHSPICLDGEATGQEEVSGFRDLERVDTNSPRGGMCLVLAEGIALKAPKIQRYTRNLDEVDWPWLQDLIDGTIGKDDGDDAAAEGTDDGEGEEVDGPADETAADAPEDPAGPPRVDPADKYLRDLIAGRPVFGHPSRPGGFRLRYGRARNHGFATAGVHPATMHVLDDFLATGTQIKTERPGKAGGVVPVDSIEGPTVKLANGDVRRIDDPETALELRNGIVEILDVGEYLVNYGEFIENNHSLAPSSYVVEWWEQDLEHAGADLQALRDDPHVDLADPSAEAALAWAEEFDAPLHPAYTPLWHDVSVEQFDALATAASEGRFVEADGATLSPDASTVDEGDTLVVERTDAVCATLETLLVEHTQGEQTVTVPDARPLVASLGLTDELERTWSLDDLSERARTWGEEGEGDNAVEAVNEVAPFTVRERAPTRIGNRMGRPEKSESREMSPAVHTLFPIGEAGGSQRDVSQAAKHTASMQGKAGQVSVQVARRECPDCERRTFKARCPDCRTHTEAVYECHKCEVRADLDESGRALCPRCGGEAEPVQFAEIDLRSELDDALANVGERPGVYDILKGVKGLTSEHKLPEPIEKGILRAKHGVSSFKDGTVRYDMTDLPVTAVRASELDVTVDQLRGLGYDTDVDGDPLRHDDQLVELRVQDVVLSDGAAEHMLKTANFVDALLEQYYGLEPFYDVDDREDLVGELVFGMAPHTSAAVVGRVVGFTSAAVGYAHPYFHAAKRRNCFHPETKLWYESEDDWTHGSIEQFVETHLDESTADTDNFGTLVSEPDGEVRVPSVTADGEPVLKPVEAVSKHVAPDHLVNLETAAGRSLAVTPDHEMLVWREGVSRVRASELTKGDEILARQSTAEPPVDVPLAADGGITRSEVTAIEIVRSDIDHTYCLTVADTHNVAVEGLLAKNCDGDEDCVMLLMDGLLNFSKQYLPDKRGGSVTEDSRLVAVDPEGDVRFPTFEEFWQELDSPIHHDGKFEKKLVEDSGWRTYAFNEDHAAGLKPIERAIRYQAADDERLVRIETQFGRSLDITEHHSMFRYDDGIEEVAGGDLEAGDLVLAPRQFDVEPNETTIDVANCIDDPYVVINDHTEDLLRTVWESSDRGSDAHAAFTSGLSYRLSKSKIPYDRFERILAHGGFDVPTDVEIGIRGSSNGITRTIDVDEDFAWLLGLFVAEGSLSGANPTLFNADEEVVDQAVEKAAATLGVEPAVEWSNKSYRVRFPAVFREVLYQFGFKDIDSYSSNEKVVPKCILRAPDDVALAFIRGFVVGDESEPNNINYSSIQFHTTSEHVKNGFVFLLHRFGLVANVSRRERDERRQPIYTVSVSGGATDNPLRRVLDGEDEYLPKSLVVGIPDALMELREMDIDGIKRTIPKYLKRRENISLKKLREIVAETDNKSLTCEARQRLDELRPLVDGDISYLHVQSVEPIDYDSHLYDLQVGGEPVFTANWLYAHNSMDAPLVMSSRIDPSEIDDEAHNMDIVDRYPREFYLAARDLSEPEEVPIRIAEETLGTDEEYSGFRHTHDTSDIALGPALSAYKTLGSMMDKMDAQLELARKLHAVDETDVAERVIEGHFLPDLIGNLRAFSRQETRCLDCGEKYRRMPLTGDCRECGGRVNLTVHQGSVNKYMDTAIHVADEYDCRDYTKQRLEVLEQSLESVFENDKNKQSGIADFM